MESTLKSEWSKPRTILFATEVPCNEKAFSFALAQAAAYGAQLILFHVFDTLVAGTSENAGARYYDYSGSAQSEINHLQPLASRAMAAGVPCEVVVRPGLAADQILSYASENPVDRIVMGTHSPGPIGKLLVGSVAEAVLRTAKVPVCVVGPNVPAVALEGPRIQTVLCACSLKESTSVVSNFAAHVAMEHSSRLVLQHIIQPQERTEVLAGHTIDDIEDELLRLIPADIQEKIDVQVVVVPGDPAEELLYQSRSQQADLIVLGAHGASAFAAITRHGIVYKVMAQAHCPVLTLSPAVLAQGGSTGEQANSSEKFIAGVF